MPNWEIIEKLWKQIFGAEATIQLLRVIGTVFTIWLALWLISQIIELWKNTFWPIFYNSEEKRRNFRRRLFAQHLEHEIKVINRQERDWEDYRFTELEAEVEAEGIHTISSIIPFIKREYKGLRREKSLSKALKGSKDPIILLEGDPGSGKSIALRHIALDLLQKAEQSRSNRSLLPIYVNLRGLKRSKNQTIDRQLIVNYILSSINRSNIRDVDIFLENEFEVGLREGTWFFLFDSFDEIPDVLSSREVDPIIRKYADAISDFLHGMNRCRGIIASRYFRGPGHVEWTRFNIVGLSLERQAQLVKRARVSNYEEQVLIGQLTSARPEIQTMVANPLFLSMVIEQVLAGQEFPESTFTVFETYITQRFEQDQERLRKRFGLDHSQLRKVAEIIAFCMTADDNIGLSPYRESIKESIEFFHIETISDIDNCLDALEFIKIGRSDITLGSGEAKSFAFSHRRFQEYFATSFVMKAANRVSPARLIADAKWRETAVVLCQTQREQKLHDLIFEAGENLYVYAIEIENWAKSVEEKNEVPAALPWPSGLLHLLSLLQDGFNNRKYLLPDYIENNASVILHLAQSCGIFPDRKWSLEVAGIARQSTLLDALRGAIQDSSYLLNQVAYEQVSKLESMPEDVSTWIRKSLIEKAASFQLRRQRFTTQAFLSRLPNKDNYLRLLRLLLTLPIIDLILHIAFALIMFFSVSSDLNPGVGIPAPFPILFLGMILFTLSFMSYLLCNLIPDNDLAIMGIQSYALSYAMRILMSMVAITSTESILVKSFVILMSYLLMLPISTIILINDGFIWKNDSHVLTSPIQVFVFGFTHRKEKYASSKLILSLFVIAVFSASVPILEKLNAFDLIFNNLIWIFALTCLMLIGLLLAFRDILKRKKLENAILRVDQQKLHEWKEQQTHSANEFLELFRELRTPECMLQLIADIAEDNNLATNQGSSMAVKSAIQHIESTGITKKHAPVIDELCVLLERMQSTKET